MAIDFTLDASALEHALLKSADAADRAAKNTLTDIKNDWKRGAVDDAPIAEVNGGNLRRQIQAEVFEPGADGYIEIMANATRESSGKYKRFNYAYYIHEDKGVVKSGEKKFLDKTAIERQDEWQRWLEEEVAQELKKAGW